MLSLCTNVILYIAKDCPVPPPPVIPPVIVNFDLSCVRVVMRITNITITFRNVCYINIVSKCVVTSCFCRQMVAKLL